jgi:hypothetical protein
VSPFDDFSLRKKKVKKTASRVLATSVDICILFSEFAVVDLQIAQEFFQAI